MYLYGYIVKICLVLQTLFLVRVTLSPEFHSIISTFIFFLTPDNTSRGAGQWKVAPCTTNQKKRKRDAK